MYDNSYNKTYSRLENREIARNIKKGAITLAEEQKKELQQRNKNIKEQETLKTNIISSLCIKELIKGKHITKKQSNAISYMKIEMDCLSPTMIKLVLKFHSNNLKKYNYFLDINTILELYNSESMGKFYNSHIKQGEVKNEY